MHAVIRRLRLDFGPRVAILAGGPHTTARPHDVLAAGADVVFRGEAEVNFPEVIRRMPQGWISRMCRHPRSGSTWIPSVHFLPERECSARSRLPGAVPLPAAIARLRTFSGSGSGTGASEHRPPGGALRSVNRKVVRLLSPNAFSYGSSDGCQLTAVQSATCSRRCARHCRPKVRSSSHTSFGGQARARYTGDTRPAEGIRR